MTTAQPNFEPNIEALLDHQDWVRALARRLVADPSRADDVAQQTMLEAMTRPPRDLSRPKGWLFRVAQNAARTLGREDRRRRRREQVVARSEEISADPADAAHRAAMHKRLVDSLFELEEPYHTVVLLRFFEDLEARQIAARLERPLATVRTQLQRGIERMRERLDREFGDRRAWCAALMPLLAPKHAVTGVPFLTTLGALAMWKMILPAIGLIAALFVSYQLWNDSPIAPPSSGGSPAANVSSTAQLPDAKEQAPREAVAGRAVDVADAPSEAVPAASVAGEIRGRVVTVDGHSVPGLALAYLDPRLPKRNGSVLSYGNSSIDLDQPALRDELTSDAAIRWFARTYAPHADVVVALIKGDPVDRPRATTDGLGRFAIAGVTETSHLRVEGSDWICYGNGYVRGEDAATFVVGPAVHVAGRVVDAAGAGIKGAYVSLGFSLKSLPGLPQQLERASSYTSWNENCDSDGSFDLGVVPVHATLNVNVQRRQYITLSIPTTDIVPPVVWTLDAVPTSERKEMTGVVLHADGSIADGARVRFGQDGGPADESGRFKFDLSYWNNETQLTAYLPGLQPAIVDGLGDRLKQDVTAGHDLVLTLGSKALEISGRVVDAERVPQADVRVLLGDGIVNGSSYSTLESAIGGQGSKGERTDDEGRFTLRGLSDRTYFVRAIHDESLLVIESEPVAAGTTDLVLTAPADPFIPTLEGVLVDRFGAPVEGARVQVMTHLQRVRSGASLLPRDRPAISDRDGRFVVEDCPRQHVYLEVGGPGVKNESVAIPSDRPTDGQPLRVVVSRLLRFKLRANGNHGADHFAIRDVNDERVASTAFTPGFTSSDYVHEIDAENPPVYEVDDRGVVLVLLVGKEEVRRIPLNLRAGSLNEIDL